MAFEHPFGGLLVANATAQVQDPAGINPPSTIIQTEDPFRVRVNWTLTNIVAPFLGGDWELKVYAESIGGGFEGQLGATVNVPLSAAPALPLPRAYQADVNVPANALAPGAYRLVTLINYSNLGVPLEMAAFEEGPIIQVYAHA
jgi:hypothetical protein